jgi:hypothetical protein
LVDSDTSSQILAGSEPRSNVKVIGPGSLLTLFVPVAALIAALTSGSYLFLDYVHVLSGATWTGIDLFFGIVMGRVLGGLAPPARTQVIKKLVPIMLFLMPSLTSVAVTAGVFLAIKGGYALNSTPIIVAAILVIILMVQGIGVILPTEVRIFLELRKKSPNYERVNKLGMRNVYLSGSQSIFQVALIFVMAYLAVVL